MDFMTIGFVIEDFYTLFEIIKERNSLEIIFFRYFKIFFCRFDMVQEYVANTLALTNAVKEIKIFKAKYPEEHDQTMRLLFLEEVYGDSSSGG